ncbi:serine/threonine-protein kinase [Streptomyces sp. NPDC059533]|uniref:serine/threonine-protein kinase n=1 Tax=unclassified Streptomyces TaxID=2593676 RepID=UPI00368ACF9C
MEPLGVGDPVRLGPYRILGVLGAGGMGKVYFGRDNDGRTAAVKVLLPELAHDAHLAQRFLREAHTAQAVTSGGVARVLAAESEDSRPWIATEFLSGPTLDDAVRAYGPFDPDAVRALAASLAATLRDIHAAGLVHRDLKPPNIVLTSTGPRVIDFGIARPEHGMTLTTTGQVPVTPGYGAPEQVLGQRVGPAADVFSLGAVLAYAATGRRTFDGTHVAAVQYEVVHGEPRLDDVPAELRHLIAPCLTKDPAHRPTPDQIAGAFAPPRGADRVWLTGPLARDIARRAGDAERQAATVIGEGSAAAPSRRRVLRLSLAAGGALAAAGGATGAWWLMRGGDGLPPAGKATDAKPLSRLSAKSGEPPKPLWGPLPVAAREANELATDMLTAPLPLLDVVVFAAKEGGLAARLTTDGTEKWRLPATNPAAGLVALPGHRFVTGGPNGGLLCYEASTSKRLWTVADADTSRVLAADATAVYLVTRDGRLRAVDTATRTVRWTVTLPERAVKTPGPYAAAGADRLVLVGDDGDVLAFDTTTGAPAWKVLSQARYATQPLIVDDAVYLGGRYLKGVSLRTGTELWDPVDAQGLKTENTAGWRPPARSGDNLWIMDGTRLTRAPLATGRTTPLGSALNGPLPYLPPVVQARTLFAVEGEGRGVSAFGIDGDGRRLWTWSPESRGLWAMAGAGNRLFTVNSRNLTALPVVN